MPFVTETRQTGFAPSRVLSLADSGLSVGLMSDLLIKAVYFAGQITASGLSEALHVRFSVIGQLAREFVEQAYLTTRTIQVEGRPMAEYAITPKGEDRARRALERSEYTGPAPVPLTIYAEATRAQTLKAERITRPQVLQAYQDLVLNPALLERLGPAINSRKSLFLYGSPGNGKTTVAQRFAKLLGSDVYIPYALVVDTHIIQLFDPTYHEVVEEQTVEASPDARWIKVRRPVVIVGGELTLETLDLLFEPTVKFYEAPAQLKANNGVFMIDDFGRQLVRPEELLNRWIVPLAEGVDFLTLHTGKRLKIPFDEMIVFSTNLEPKDLVDEAFLRRIRYKLEVGDPTEDEYREIFRRACARNSIEYDDAAVTYLLRQRYPGAGLPLRACHPWDLMAQLSDFAAWRNQPPKLTQDLLNESWDTYFAKL
jgi:hypothetical protein